MTGHATFSPGDMESHAIHTAPPESSLIRAVRETAIPRLSVRAAAARAGMSPEQWGNIERGYRYTKQGEPHRSISPPAATIAKMAHSLGISQERLETEGQRPDAARMIGLMRGLRQSGESAADVILGEREIRRLWAEYDQRRAERDVAEARMREIMETITASGEARLAAKEGQR